MPSSSKRYSLFLLTFLILAFLGYAYFENPVGCWKVYYSVKELAISLIPGHQETSEDTTASSTGKSSPQPVAAPAPVTASPPAPTAVTTPVPAPVHSLVPLPADAAKLLTPAPTNPAPVSAAPAPPDAIKPWAPPDIIPAQDNWTWTTIDGNTYENVVIDKIDPETVSITHSRGVAQVPIANLPPDLQKKLNYDPVASAAALVEAKREKDHPFYHFSELADAQAAARSLHLPLAWMNGDANYAQAGQFTQVNNDAEYTAMALAYLDKNAIIIFMVGNGDLAALPSLVRDQLFILDDGPLPNGHHFNAPKIVLTDAEITKVYGRVANAQFKVDRGTSLLKLLETIK